MKYATVRRISSTNNCQKYCKVIQRKAYPDNPFQSKADKLVGWSAWQMVELCHLLVYTANSTHCQEQLFGWTLAPAGRSRWTRHLPQDPGEIVDDHRAIIGCQGVEAPATIAPAVNATCRSAQLSAPIQSPAPPPLLLKDCTPS